MQTFEAKFGAHQFMWKSHWTNEDLAILDSVKSLGLSLFEISLGDDVHFDPGRAGAHARSLEIELTVGPGNHWPADCNISSDDSTQRAKGLAWHRKNIERAGELGAAAYCGALYGYPGLILRRPPCQEELLHAAENLQVLAGFAAEHGVRLVLEPMSRFRSHLVNTSVQVMELVRLIGHPNVLVNLDTYHMVTEERDYQVAIEKTLPVLWGIHACENDRGVPGSGLVPWERVFQTLTQRQDCVRIMFETYNTGPDGFGYSRGIFQNLCPDPDEFIRQGLAFLKTYLPGARQH